MFLKMDESRMTRIFSTAVQSRTMLLLGHYRVASSMLFSGIRRTRSGTHPIRGLHI